MNNTSRSLAAATLATITAVAALSALPAPSGAHQSNARRASDARTQTLRLFDKPMATTLTTSDGTVVSHPPYPQPKSGDTLDVYSLDYVGSHVYHAEQWTFSNHLRCTFTQGPPDCVSDLATGSSLLVFDGNKLIGATGHYQGATGRVLSNKQVPGTDNASDIVARINKPMAVSPAGKSELSITPIQRKQLASYQRVVARLFGITPGARAGS